MEKIGPLNKYRILIPRILFNNQFASYVIDREFISSQTKEEKEDKPASEPPSLPPVSYYKLVSFPC